MASRNGGVGGADVGGRRGRRARFDDVAIAELPAVGDVGGLGAGGDRGRLHARAGGDLLVAARARARPAR